MGAQLRVFRRRIKSVQATKKITKAMELIASSRIVRAQQRLEAGEAHMDIGAAADDVDVDAFARREPGLLPHVTHHGGDGAKHQGRQHGWAEQCGRGQGEPNGASGANTIEAFL